MKTVHKSIKKVCIFVLTYWRQYAILKPSKDRREYI
nr:MAG TPA: hypothetical protein [Caudoviricetes sp.]